MTLAERVKAIRARARVRRSRPIALRIDAERLAARCLALVPFP